MSDDSAARRVDPTAPPRDLAQAMRRGALGRCPNCGEGKLFYRYLKVADTCSVCGEELFHQRADDAPPYVTIMVVGHIIIGGLMLAEDFWPDIPVAVHVVVWSLLTIALSLAMLPVVKGALIGLQWAFRMHGFDRHTSNPAPASTAVAPETFTESHAAP